MLVLTPLHARLGDGAVVPSVPCGRCCSLIAERHDAGADACPCSSGTFLLVAVLLPTVTANHGCLVAHLFPNDQSNKGTFRSDNMASVVCLKKNNVTSALSADVGPTTKMTCCQTIGLGACAAGARPFCSLA
jgi:hypothetical protein